MKGLIPYELPRPTVIAYYCYLCSLDYHKAINRRRYRKSLEFSLCNEQPGTVYFSLK